MVLNFDLKMYVNGELDDTEKVLIDIGTGYYVEKVRSQKLSSVKKYSNWVSHTLSS